MRRFVIVHAKYCEGEQIKLDKLGGICCTHGREDMKKAYRVLAGNPEEVGLIGWSRPRWEVSIKTECQKI
jgi:hypothetical protein